MVYNALPGNELPGYELTGYELSGYELPEYELPFPRLFEPLKILVNRNIKYYKILISPGVTKNVYLKKFFVILSTVFFIKSF